MVPRLFSRVSLNLETSWTHHSFLSSLSIISNYLELVGDLRPKPKPKPPGDASYMPSFLQEHLECKNTQPTANLHRSVKRFRGGLVFKAHRLLYHSTPGLRVIKKKKMMNT